VILGTLSFQSRPTPSYKNRDYGYLETSEYGTDFVIRSGWRLGTIAAQGEKHVSPRVHRDYGLQYRFIVSNPEFAEFLRSVWPSTVDIIEVPREPCD